ncbi:MAG TPA: GNAT family N-acetyltransferase [Patescibacteria group bacterium]|nr:GNAT family N-acetyltransferase [Patescibacteria group bacterium]
MSEREKTGNPPAQLRNYDSVGDFQSVKQNLEEAGIFWEEWEGETKPRRRSRGYPDSIIVAVVGTQVVGSVFLVDDFFPYAFRLVVKEEFRGRGIGSQLMDEAEKRAKDHRHMDLAILVDDDDPELQAWYEKRGYHKEHAYRSMWKELT